MDERNFRSFYYEKVGFKNVEEKRSLEILLRDEHLDISKLRQFCLRFGVPGTYYKNLVWKILLGVIPIHVKCHNYVMEQRKEEYCNLVHALQLMRIINDVQKPQDFVAIWLLHTGQLKFENNLDREKNFIAIITSLLVFFVDNNIDIYWLGKTLYDQVLKFQPEIKKLIECTHNLLEKEDPVLCKHFNGEIWDNLPIKDWFSCCYAGVLNEAALGRIWDKFCAGSYKILIYVTVTMLTTLRTKLLICTKAEGCLIAIYAMSEEIADVIANKSIELWQKHGSSLTVYDKPIP